jgi:hypothetical protein
MMAILLSFFHHTTHFFESHESWLPVIRIVFQVHHVFDHFLHHLGVLQAGTFQVTITLDSSVILKHELKFSLHLIGFLSFGRSPKFFVSSTESFDFFSAHIVITGFIVGKAVSFGLTGFSDERLNIFKNFGKIWLFGSGLRVKVFSSGQDRLNIGHAARHVIGLSTVGLSGHDISL